MNPTYTSDGFGVLFAEAAQSYGASEIRGDEQLQWLKQRHLLQAGLTYLDVGCYMGAFISGLPEEIAAIGVDIDPGAIAEAQARHGAPHRHFLAADFEQFSLEKDVDVMTMFHVLEHLPRPLRVLQMLRSLAKPHTRLVVEVPILELAKTNDINGFLTVSHLTHFSKATLHSLAASAGWEIEDTTAQTDYNGYRIVARPVESQVFSIAGDDRVLLYDYLGHFYEQLARCTKRLNDVPASARRVVWGAGFHTELVYQQSSFFSSPETQYLLVDMDATKQGQTWRGIPIEHPDCLASLDWQDTHLLVSSYGHQEAIASAARAYGIPDERIHCIYEEIRRY